MRDGRRAEFAGFAGFADERRRAQIPDPNAEATFLLSVPDANDVEPLTHAAWRAAAGAARRHIVPRIPGSRSLGASAARRERVLARWGWAMRPNW